VGIGRGGGGGTGGCAGALVFVETPTPKGFHGVGAGQGGRALRGGGQGGAEQWPVFFGHKTRGGKKKLGGWLLGGLGGFRQSPPGREFQGEGSEGGCGEVPSTWGAVGGGTGAKRTNLKRGGAGVCTSKRGGGGEKVGQTSAGKRGGGGGRSL